MGSFQPAREDVMALRPYRGAQEAVGVLDGRGHDDLEPGDVGEEGLDRLAVVEPAVHPATERRPDHQRQADGAVRPVAHPRHLRLEFAVPRGEPEAALEHHLQVARLDVEHVEVPGEARPRVQPPAGLGHPGHHRLVAQGLGGQRGALDPLDDQHALAGEVAHDPGPHGLGGRHGVEVLDLAVHGQ